MTTSEIHTRSRKASNKGEAAGPDPEDATPDPKFNWIEQLNKETLVLELRKFGLDTGGKSAELKLRLRRFFNTGYDPDDPIFIAQAPAPHPFELPAHLQPAPLQPPPVLQKPQAQPPVISVQPAPVNPLDVVRKWNIYFDGTGDSVSFLERIQELTAIYQFTDAQLLNTVPQLLRGKALLWCRNNRNNWRIWKDFLADFEIFYLPPRYRIKLREEIYNRTQGENEKFKDYVIAIQTLMRRLGDFSRNEQITRIYENMKPEYKTYIKPDDFDNLAYLVMLAEQYEQVQAEVKNYRPPPPVSKAYFTETAYSSRPKHPETTPLKVAQIPAKPKPEKVSPRTPEKSSVENKTQVNQPSHPNKVYPDYTRNTSCWRCGRRSHMRDDCRSQPKLFCSWCGQLGTMTKNCNCPKPENLNNSQTNRGRSGN